MPESVRLALLLWVIAVAVELVHQIVTVAMSLADPSSLEAAARQAAESQEGTELSAGAITTSVYLSIGFMALLALAIVVVLAVMLEAIIKQRRYAGGARRLWQIFSFYFVFRAMTVFLAAPGGTNIPVAMYLVDGSLQIIVAVAAVLGTVFASRSVVRQWTGEEDRDDKNNGTKPETADKSSGTPDRNAQ